MSVNRLQHGLMTLIFVGLLSAVPVTQCMVDGLRGDRPKILDLFANSSTSDRRSTFVQNLSKQNHLARFVRPWTQTLRFVILGETPAKTQRGHDGWLFYQPALQYLIEGQPPVDSPAQAEIVKAVTHFRDQLQARGTHLLLLIAPNKASVYPDKFTGWAAYRSGPVNPQTLALIANLRQAGVELVDLFSLFKAARNTSTPIDAETYYLAQDSHWSPEGMDRAAHFVAERLHQLGWIAKGSPQRYSLQPAPIERHGDIVTMMQVPQIQQHFVPESLDCTQVFDSETQTLYADDPNASILVLGDSFLRIYSRDEPKTAGFIEHLAYHLGQPLFSIVNDGGASTLVRQQLARKPEYLKHKKVVIWEFVERDIRFGTEGWQVISLLKESEQ